MVHCRHERPSCQNDDEPETSPQAEAQVASQDPWCEHFSWSLWWRLPTSVRIRWWRETDYNKLEASAELLEIVRQALSESSGAP
jgi:hypothetical protein